jgi:phenylalanyl-tRNA synthetase alpha chain
MPKINLKSIKNKTKKEIEKAENLRELDKVFKKYLGKRGELSLILRSLKKLPPKKRVKLGKEANELKVFLRKKIEQKEKIFKKKAEKEIRKRARIDVTLPGKKFRVGHLHPLTQTKKEIEDIFQSLGFSVIEGPEVENEWYNFDALNIPKDHPARDFWDTLYLKRGNLLRTHTSPVQIRFMEKNQPPLRIIVPGRVFRHEATDASHEFNFYQIEGLMVDERGKISVANFKAVIEDFLKKFFDKSVKIRLRPTFYPFTEPSFEVDVSCPICKGKGCSICKKSGWVEIMGAGMVHQNVFKNSGLNPKQWQGFAFGMGMDRLAMIKYKINDIRLFYSGDLRFLKQF